MPDMPNYLAVLLRTLQRERLYAAINIGGLSLGVASCLILGLFLRSELTYDQHFVLHDRIYRVVNEYATGATAIRAAVTPHVLGPMLAADNPQIKAYVRFQKNGGNGDGVAIHHGSDTYYWTNSYFVDDDIFQVFSHKILYGDPTTALKDPSSVAVSATFARRYFGNLNPIGQTITTDAGIASRITLVFDDLPANTHLKYDLLFSGNNAAVRDADDPTQRRRQLWGVNTFTYLLMAADFNPATWPRISETFYKRYMEDPDKTSRQSWRSWLQPLSSIHLGLDVLGDEPTGNPVYLYGCAAVGLFILLVACINYMNLATARATRRARTVGIRKILGASRAALVLQFLGEALLFALIAVIAGAAIVEVALRLSPINSLMDGQVHFDLIADPQLLGWLISLAVLIGVLAGSYPAFYLSSWAPLSALTGQLQPGKGSLRLRKALVLLQFTISTAVVASTFLMGAQMRYIASRPLGFQKENRVLVTLRGAATIGNIPTIRTELSKNSHILGVSQAQFAVGQPPGVGSGQIENKDGLMTSTLLTQIAFDEDFVRVMGMKVVEGRDFSKRTPANEGTNFLVNEAMVRKMGWSNPVGRRVQIGNRTGRVVGVVANFNFKSLHELIEPLLMYPLVNDFSSTPEAYRAFAQSILVLNISGEDVAGTLAYVKRVMLKIDPRHSLEYTFLDESLDTMYKSEHQLLRLIAIFAGICIFIACLGLFGLASFTTAQRTTEIGTRRVLGATSWQIIAMLSRPILALIVVASVLATVLSYFAIDEWLSGFAYRTRIDPLMFVVSGVITGIVAIVTVALQSYKVASADPVETLRRV